MPEGSIHITPLSRHPRLYAVAFVPRHGRMRGLSWRECSRLEEIRELLTQAGVGLDEVARALRNTYQGQSVSIRNVMLDEPALERLGLKTPDPPEPP